MYQRLGMVKTKYWNFFLFPGDTKASVFLICISEHPITLNNPNMTTETADASCTSRKNIETIVEGPCSWINLKTQNG